MKLIRGGLSGLGDYGTVGGANYGGILPDLTGGSSYGNTPFPGPQPVTNDQLVTNAGIPASVQASLQNQANIAASQPGIPTASNVGTTYAPAVTANPLVSLLATLTGKGQQPTVAVSAAGSLTSLVLPLGLAAVALILLTRKKS